MKNETEVRDRIRGLVVQELTRRTREATKRLPCKCRYNVQHRLDGRKEVEGSTNENYNRVAQAGPRSLPVLGLCMYGAENPESWPGNICEDPVDAQRCPMFDPILSKEGLLGALREDVDNPRWVQEHMPGLYELLWVVGSEDIQVPWWKRLWFRFLRIRVEPVREPPKALLEEALAEQDEA